MSLPQRSTRLSVELRLLGLLGFGWTFAVLHAALWTGLTLGWPQHLQELPWAMLALPHAVALTVATVALYSDLPLARWPGTARPHLRAVPTLLLGLPTLVFAPLFLARDRRASAGPPPDPDTARRAFAQLLQIPRLLALRFSTWAAAAFAVDAIVLGYAAGWPREHIVMTAVLWLALLGPVTAVMVGYARAVVRPEYLNAPHRVRRFAHRSDLRVRLVAQATLVAASMVAAPLCVGVLFHLDHRDEAPAQRATDVARELLELARTDELETLGQRLVEHPEATVRIGERVLGAPAETLHHGAVGIVELVPEVRSAAVERNAEITVSVPFTPAPDVPWGALGFGGFIILAAAVASAIFVARSVHRDVVRATARTRAVVDGRAMRRAVEGSFATLEARTLVASVDRLVGRITEANVSRYIAIEKAKEADRLKSQFLANMSHDLRSPLNSILGFSELLLSGIDGEITDSQREMLQTILDSGRGLLQEIDDILDTAKIEASRLELSPEPTPVATLVTRAIHKAKKRRPYSSTEYDLQVAAGLPPAFCDPYRTVQALTNVLLFASEGNDDARIDIRIQAGNTERGRALFIDVSTTHHPASSHDLERARSGFFRIPGHRGLGLGLPLAGSILELQSGSLGIEELERGMVFSVELGAANRRVRRTPPELEMHAS